MNYESQPLQIHERDAMKSDPVIKQRLQRSYELMLDFYGMRLLDANTGLLDRSLPPRNYESRYKNLVRKCTGILSQYARSLISRSRCAIQGQCTITCAYLAY
jgi:hypothetical protein